MPDEITPASDSDSATATASGLQGNNGGNGAASDSDSVKATASGLQGNNGGNGAASDSDSVTAIASGLQGNNGGNGAASDTDSFATAMTGTPVNNGQNVGLELVRKWNDMFWLSVFGSHSAALVARLGISGVNYFGMFQQLGDIEYLIPKKELTEFYWKFYGVSASVGGIIAVVWFLLLGLISDYILKMSLHILTAYFAVISISCFCSQYTFWAVFFAIVTCFHILFLVSVFEKIPFALLVLRNCVKLVWDIKEVVRITYAFLITMNLWLVLWTFGVAGVLASNKYGVRGWIVVLELSVSLLWTYLVLSGILHVVVSRVVYRFIHDESMPSNLLVASLLSAITTSFGSVCYGSVHIGTIELLRAIIKGLRSRVKTNECFFCCFDFLFYLIETLVRFFNKYAYVQIGINGKNFNYSSRDAWELFQSTGVETLISYDCSGTIIWMSTILCGLITGTCAAAWPWITASEIVAMVGVTSMIIGIVLSGIAMTAVDSALTSIYTCYAQDSSLILRWDTRFGNRLSDMYQLRIQHRSNLATEP